MCESVKTLCENVTSSGSVTVCDWKLSNEMKFAKAVSARQCAQKKEYTCDTILKDVKARTERAMDEVNTKIEFRLNDVKYWMDQLTSLIKDNAKECKALEASIDRLTRALEATKQPLCVARKCIDLRKCRIGGEVVADNVHFELAKEINTYCKIQPLLSNLIEQAKEQIRLLRKSAFNLKKDFDGKEAAMEKDELAKNLNSPANTLKVNNKEQRKHIHPDEWLASVKSNLKDGEKQIHDSLHLRDIIEDTLSRTYEEQIKQFQATNRAIRKRIEELREAKHQMKENLDRILKSKGEMEENIKKIKAGICDILEAIKIVESKISIRNCRPGDERTKDEPYYRLLEQKNDLLKDLTTLENKLKDSEKALKSLRRRQLDLEEEIQLKSNSVDIDETHVNTIRLGIMIYKF